MNNTAAYKITGYYNNSISSSSERNDEITREIKSYKNLPVGWDYGVGEPAAQKVIEKAITLYNIGCDLGFEAEPHPLTEGGVSITFFIKDHFLDVDVNSNLTIGLNYEIGIGKPYKKEWREKVANIELMITKLTEIKERCENLYGQSNSVIIVHQKEGSGMIKYLEITKTPSPYSISIV